MNAFTFAKIKKFDGFLFDFPLVIPAIRELFFAMERQSPEVDCRTKAYCRKNKT